MRFSRHRTLRGNTPLTELDLPKKTVDYLDKILYIKTVRHLSHCTAGKLRLHHVSMTVLRKIETELAKHDLRLAKEGK